MKKEMRLLGIVFLVMLSIILISQFVLAQTIFDPVKDMFVNWQAGKISENLAKYLFLVLMTLLVWSILDVVEIPKSSGVRVLIGIIVAFLAVGYLTPNEIWVTLSSYSALGMTLLFLLPFVIMLFFTLRVAASGGAAGVVAQYFIWIIYFIFLVYRTVWGMIQGHIKIGDPTTWIFVGALVLTAIAVFFNKVIVKWVGQETLEAQSTKAEETLKKATKMEKLQAKGLEELGEK